jgi:hypothetical protein
MITPLIGEALIVALQAVAIAGLLRFVHALYRDLAGLCSRKDLR